MDSSNYLDEIKNIHINILYFLDDDIDTEENFQNLVSLFNDQNIQEDKNKLKLILHSIVEISNNYHRCPNFFSKIEQILLIFKNDIINYFSNWEIFHIFRSNKRVLLFLIEEKIIKIDEYIIKKLNGAKYIFNQYHSFLALEIKPYINEKNCSQYKLVSNLCENVPNNFNEKRKDGENDNSISKIIQNDLIDDFIQYKDIELNYKIKQSIYETNAFLLSKEPTLIEYAAFYGSIRIFQYLQKNKVPLTSSLWIYAIHCNNREMIHILEENHVKPENGSYKNCLEESLKCHHNDIAYYLITKYFPNFNSEYILPYSLKYYNFNYIDNESINAFSFISLCKFDYYIFVDILLKDASIDINEEIKLIF